MIKKQENAQFFEDLKNFTAKQVAAKYQMKLPTIYGYKQRYGFNTKLRDRVPVDFAEYIKTHNIWQTSRHYNVSYPTIHNWEKVVNSKCAQIKGEGKLERNEDIRKMYPEKTYEEIAKLYGITKQRVEQIINYKDNFYRKENCK